jgi:hypothetical protein
MRHDTGVTPKTPAIQAGFEFHFFNSLISLSASEGIFEPEPAVLWTHATVLTIEAKLHKRN